MGILWVNCCMRKESRTLELTNAFLSAYQKKHPEDRVEELRLASENIGPMLEEELRLRDELAGRGAFGDPMFRYAVQFRQADKIIVSAPYWDLSFPSLLRAYFERIFVVGLTFGYAKDGVQSGCRAQKLLYITTAGGAVGNYDLGSGYIKGICETMLGIPEFSSVKAENLDMDGADIRAIMREACQRAVKLGGEW